MLKIENRYFNKLINDNLIVIDIFRWELMVLNQSAAYIWLYINERKATIDIITSHISEEFDIDKNEALIYIKNLLNEWLEKNWIEIDSNNFFQPNQNLTKIENSHKISSIETFNKFVKDIPKVYSKDLDFLNKSINFTIFQSEDAKYPELVPRAIAFLDGLKKNNSDKVYKKIEIVSVSRGLFIKKDNVVFEVFNPISCLSRMVLWGFYAAYSQNELLATIHAASLGKEKGMIIFPGISGSGKTTLAAYLASKNWLYCGDDIIGLSSISNKIEVLPFQSALSIKPGSWEILSKIYPSLLNSKVVPYNGKDAKFIPAPEKSLYFSKENSRIPLAIVFPKYKTKTSARLESIDTIKAIESLIEVGIRTGEKLEHVLLDKLFNIIDDLPKYNLYYSSMEEAELILDEILEKN